MYKKRNLLAALAGSLLLSGSILAQADRQSPPMAPRVEREVQIFTSGDSYLGVELQEVSKDNFEKLGLREVRGAAVQKVADDSPAKKAGLAEGDVITKFNGEEVKSVRQLRRLIGETAPDHQAKMTVWRNGSERDLTATLGKRTAPVFQNAGALEQLYGLPGIPEFPTQPPTPLPPGAPDVFTTIRPGARRIGISTVPLNKDLGEYFGVSEGRGVLISNVIADSPAAKAGLKSGDVVIEVDGKTVATAGELTGALNTASRKTVEMKIIRNKKSQTVTVEPAKAEETFRFFRTAPNS